jgi:leucyl aminopeptidase (aminopeptidase T)
MILQKKLRLSAKKLLKNNLEIRKKEKILIVTDKEDDEICQAIASEARKTSKNVMVTRITSDRSNSSPLPQLGKTFSGVDVIIATTSKSISHSPETRIARKRFGVRVASMPNINEELFMKAFSISIEEQKKINKKALAALKGKTVRVTSPSGTDLRVDISRYKFKSDDGDCSKRGSLRNIPSGEVDAAPISRVNGTLAIDVWETRIRPKNIRTKIKNGKISGHSREATPFVSYLKKIGECALHVVELGIGTNPKHRQPIGNILHDEKILGSAHIAFGGYGNLRRCPIHLDVIILKPTIQVDNKIIMRNGVPKW